MQETRTGAPVAGIGCANPVCPNANWASRALPRWRVTEGGVSLAVIHACDASCAQTAAQLVAAQYGRKGQQPATTLPIL